MSEKEVNTISHLLEVEQNALALTFQAQEDADKKIVAAKAQADAEFQARFQKIVDECEKSYIEKSDALEESKSRRISEYRSKITSSALDKKAFSAFLDSILLTKSS